MPAQNLSRANVDDTYAHVYNRGIENKNIFNDTQDYEVFIGYLKDYLSAPAAPEETKKAFSINGRTFRGTPHQSKNYYNKVELLAYSLTANDFHLLVHQVARDSLEGLIRSLCTRYSMYFNKKYQRSGPLFQGPYKSIVIQDYTLLLNLTRSFHSNHYSSYPEYLGTRISSWVKPTAVLSFFNKVKNDSFKGTSDYKDFVEKYDTGQKERVPVSEVPAKSAPHPLERRNPTSEAVTDIKPRINISEFLVIGSMFLLLLFLGIRNVNATKNKNLMPFPTPMVSGASTTSTQTEPTNPVVEVIPTEAIPLEVIPIEIIPTENVAQNIILVEIKIYDGSRSVNIRQKPTVYSEKIGEAKDTDIFEYVSLNSGWYEIKLADGSIGFVSAKYIKVMEEINN